MREVVIFSPLWHKLPVRGYGAIERITLERAVALRRLGYKVQMVANLEEEGFADLLITAKVDLNFPKKRKDEIIWLLTFKWRRYLSTFFKLKDLIWDAPILSDESSIDPFNNYYLSKQMYPRKLLYFLHGNYYFSNPLAKLLFQPLDTILGSTKKTFYGTLNMHLLEEFRKRGLNAFYMPNGIDFPEENKIEGKNDDEFLLFVGAIRPVKAPHVAIEIANRLNKKLVLAGPVQDLAYFESKIKPRLGAMVRYVGEIDRSDLNTLFSKASALLFTSEWNDPQPTVVLEAASRGTPVLAYNYGYYSGIYEMVDNYRNGFIGTIDQIVENYQSISDMRKLDIYRYTKAKWSWDVVLKRYHIPVIEIMAENENRI